ESCKTVAEIADNRVNTLLETLSDKANFKPKSQTVELFGLCPNCEPGDNNE
ncbi:MAG: hypothetical protein HON20_04510, partial [Cellvibrionales bacterium]|nr:hypothetical protein [Cellvibrionales bacterium]